MPVQIFWASPKIWLHLVPLQKLLCWHKNQFYWMQIIFLSGTKCLWLAQYVNKFLVRHKKFGPAQNILRPVKGQDISVPGSKVFQGEECSRKQTVLRGKVFLGSKCSSKQSMSLQSVLGSVSADTLLVIQMVPILPWFLSIGKTCLTQMFCKWNNFKCKQLMWIPPLMS